MYDAQTAARPPRSGKAILATMQNLVYDQASYDILVLRREPVRLPHRPVRGLDEPAGERHAAVHLRHARLHRADERGSGGHAVARAVGCGPVHGGVRSSDRGTRGDPRPGGTSSGGDSSSTLIIAGLVVVVVVVGGLLVARRRKPGSSEDE